VGRFELQVCRSCGAVQYPPREACHRCLSSVLDWRLQPGGAELLSETTLLHSHDEFFRSRLPIRLGLVRLDNGPSAVVFLDDGVAAPPCRVRVDVRLDRAAQGVLVAFAEGGGVTRSIQSKLLREMSCDPRGRKVLVTDAGTPVGVALVRALVDAGAAVIWAGCSPAAATRGGLEDILGALEPVRLTPFDATSDESVRGAAGQIALQVDILINNAEPIGTPNAGTAAGEVGQQRASGGPGAPAGGLLPNSPPPLVGAVPAHGAGPALVRLAREFAPAMQARGASAAATAGDPMMAWVNLFTITLAASRDAACSLAQSQRAEMLPAGIRVINVFPGPEIAPVALAQSIVKALQDGIEDLYPGEVAQEWLTQWRNNPGELERARAPDR